MKTENLEYLIDYIDELNSESQDTFDDKLYVKIKKSKTELDELKKDTNDRMAIAQEIYDKLLFKWKYIDNEKAITLYDVREIFDEYISRADLKEHP